MKKFFRLSIFVLASLFLAYPCNCANYESVSVSAITPTSVSTDSELSVETLIAIVSSPSSSIYTQDSDTVEENTQETVLEEIEILEEIEDLDDFEPEKFSVRFQNGVEIYSKNSEFKISKDLIKQLDSIYKAYPGTSISWGLYSLEDDSYISFNKDTEYTSCSTIKVVYSLYCLEQVKQGKASLNDTLVYDKNKHHYVSKTASSSTIAKLGKTKFTLKEVIYYALYTSDNDAYMMLLYYFGYDGFNDYIEALGSTTEISPNFKYGYATVSNRAIEWKKIYSFYNKKGKTSKFLKETLLDAKYGYIEEGLSKLGYNTAHKSGWSDKYGAAHDCAIVYTPDGEYLMIILTQKYGQKPKKELVKKLSPVLNNIWLEYSNSD